MAFYGPETELSAGCNGFKRGSKDIDGSLVALEVVVAQPIVGDLSEGKNLGFVQSPKYCGCDCCLKSGTCESASTFDHGSRSARQECFPAHSPSAQHKRRRKGQDYVRIDKNQRCWSTILQRRHQKGSFPSQISQRFQTNSTVG